VAPAGDEARRLERHRGNEGDRRVRRDAARELPPEERPEVVDKLSPEGQLPSDDAIRSELAKP
jgi:hypothetical protein